MRSFHANEALSREIGEIFIERKESRSPLLALLGIPGTAPDSPSLRNTRSLMAMLIPSHRLPAAHDFGESGWLEVLERHLEHYLL